jgi:ribosome-associated protein
MIRVTEDIAISEGELDESFVRASGPGGQNVNKVATAVQLRFAVDASPGLPEPVRARVKALAGRRLTQHGVIVITAQRFRSLERNREDARARLIELIRRAATPPRPRRPTRPSAGSKRRRLEAKSRRSSLKTLRTAKPQLD